MDRKALLDTLILELESQISINPEKDGAIAATNALIFIKHEQNSDHLRKQFLLDDIRDVILQEKLSEYTDKITHGKFVNDTILQEAQEATRNKHTRRLSVDLHSSEVLDEITNEQNDDDSNEDENLKQLKKRLLQGSRSRDSTKNAVTFDEQLHNEESKQEDILNDMFQFIQGIKDGANAFNEKLNQDQNVLKAAEAGLEMTSEKLTKSRNNLSKTISQLGLLDSLKIFGMVMLSFFFCLIIIKIFPKW